MKWIYYSLLGVGTGIVLTLLTQKAASKASEISFFSRKTVDDVYEKLEDAYEAVKQVDVSGMKQELLSKLDDIKNRFMEFDMAEVKENAEDVISRFVFEIKNITSQIESYMAAKWLKLKDQTA